MSDTPAVVVLTADSTFLAELAARKTSTHFALVSAPIAASSSR